MRKPWYSDPPHEAHWLHQVLTPLLALFRHWVRRFRAKNLSAGATQSMRDHAHTLSDFRVPTLSIECEPCGRRGRYNIARLMEKYGDAKLPELLHTLAADCPKTNAARIYDRCRVRYGADSRLS